MKYYIGVDLGGTNVRVARVSEQGEISKIIKESTEIEKGVEHVINKIIRMIEEIGELDTISGIGMGVPGPVDTDNGIMMLATNLPGFEGYPMAETIRKHFNIPVFADNDVNVACLAESFHGAGKGYPLCYYVTISTGIGGAFSFNNRLVSGKNGYAGEVANIIVDRNREKVNYLNVGAVENEASGTAITRKGKAVFGDHIEHAGMVFDLAREGDEKALKLVDDMAYDLAQMFSAVAHVVDPHIFVVGGGCMKSKDVFWDKMIEYYKPMVHVGMRDVIFAEAKLAEPGLIGAAMLPMSFGK